MLERGTDPHRVDVTTLPSPRLLHTHLTYDVIPKGTDDTKCKYIYLARNPKDVAVSFYEFMKAFGSGVGYNGPWEFFARLFVEGKGEIYRQLITTFKSLLVYCGQSSITVPHQTVSIQLLFMALTLVLHFKLCCSRKYPYPSHRRFFSLNPPTLHTFKVILSFKNFGF